MRESGVRILEAAQPRCSGHSSDGSGRQCKQTRGLTRTRDGTYVCATHGGTSPQMRRAAARRKQESRVLSIMERVAADMPEGIDPARLLMQQVVWTAVAARCWREKVQREVDDWTAMVSYGVQGRRLEVDPRVKAWQEAEIAAGKMAKLAVDAGIQQKQVELMAETAAMVGTALRGAVYDADLGLTAEQQERLLDRVVALLPAA